MIYTGEDKVEFLATTVRVLRGRRWGSCKNCWDRWGSLIMCQLAASAPPGPWWGAPPEWDKCIAAQSVEWIRPALATPPQSNAVQQAPLSDYFWCKRLPVKTPSNVIRLAFQPFNIEGLWLHRVRLCLSADTCSRFNLQFSDQADWD